MPSVCQKEKPLAAVPVTVTMVQSAATTSGAAVEAETPLKLCLSVVEKKVRNLEKRKVRILYAARGSTARCAASVCNGAGRMATASQHVALGSPPPPFSRDRSIVVVPASFRTRRKDGEPGAVGSS